MVSYTEMLARQSLPKTARWEWECVLMELCFFFYSYHCNVLEKGYVIVMWTLSSFSAQMEGVETEAKISALEEAALLHWRWEPWTQRLPVRWSELAGPLLVQVCNIQVEFLDRSFPHLILCIWDVKVQVVALHLCKSMVFKWFGHVFPCSLSHDPNV